MNHKAVTFLAGLGAFLVVALLIFAMKHYIAPAPLSASRSAERAAALKEIRESSQKLLATAEVTDAAKGNVRLKIERAMELTIQEYGKDPSGARTNLVARANKAAEPPPKAPEAPNKFE
ncbi:MAG: hypothetical protein QOF48_2080 [Verrucomicrobiota bacterium]|jgi:hypothetical protein